MKFLAVLLALIISAEAIKVKQQDSIKDKRPWWDPGPYYVWSQQCSSAWRVEWGMDQECCRGAYGLGDLNELKYC